LLNIDNRISLLPIWRYIQYYRRSIGSDVCLRNQNNVNITKMVFSADSRDLIRLLKLEKNMMLKSLSQNFPASREHCQD